MEINKLIKNIPEANLVDYIKAKYAKVIFNPLKFKDNSIKNRSLGFIISDDKLVLGYVDNDGNLCKLMDPFDLSEM